MIKPFVDYGGLLVHLREIVAIEICVAVEKRVGQMNVRDAASGHLVHLAAIVFHPLEMTKREFVIERDDGDIA